MYLFLSALIVVFLSTPAVADDLACFDPGDLKKNVGIWEGTYRYYDMDGRMIDSHASLQVVQLECNDWVQKNTFTWAEGRKIVSDFHAQLVGRGSLHFDLEHISGDIKEESGNSVASWKNKQTASRHYQILRFVNDDVRMRSIMNIDDRGPTGWVLGIEHRVKTQVEPKNKE